MAAPPPNCREENFVSDPYGRTDRKGGLFALLVSMCTVASVHAAPGELDPTFNSGGKRVVGDRQLVHQPLQRLRSRPVPDPVLELVAGGKVALRLVHPLLTALLLSALAAFPAMAQEGFEVAVSVDCGGDPERIAIENTGATPIMVTRVGSLRDRRGDELFARNDRVGPGESVTYYAGGSAPRGGIVLTDRPIFNGGPEEEGVAVDFDSDAGPQTAAVTCGEASVIIGAEPAFGETPQLGATPAPLPGMPGRAGAGGSRDVGPQLIGIAAAVSVLVAASCVALRRR